MTAGTTDTTETPNEETRLAVTGATGRMGRAVLDAAAERGTLTVVLAVNRDPAAADADGSRAIEPAADLPAMLNERVPDVLVDFSGPDSAVEYANACADTGVAFVTGTTGFDDAQRGRLREASETIPVLRAANFSRGIQALLGAVGEAIGALPGYDVELTETHHNRKRDAPSGTAKTILDRIETSRSNGEIDDSDAEVSDRTYGREGIQPRTEGEIGVHVRRAGDVRGEHEVLVAGNDEVLTLTHRAESRGVFAAGALDSAAWLAGRDPGVYEFGEVLR